MRCGEDRKLSFTQVLSVGVVSMILSQFEDGSLVAF